MSPNPPFVDAASRRQTSRRSRRQRRARGVSYPGIGATIIGGAVVAALFLPATTASARDAADQAQIQSYQATVRVEKNGSLHVAETVVYDFSVTSASAVKREIVTRESYDAESDRVYALGNVVVDAVQTDVDATITTDGGRAAIDVEFSEPQTDTVTLTFNYDVAGAVAETADGLEVRWPVVQGFQQPIATARVEWNATDVIWLSCLAGPAGSSRPCTMSQLVDVSTPTMEQKGLASGEQMVGILGLNADSGVAPSTDLQSRWSIARSFTANGAPVYVALAVLLLGLLFPTWLWLSRGRDTAGREPREVRPMTAMGDRMLFSPPSAVRPGQMGTIVDERADVVDVSSTIVDLAVRNYIFVEELSRTQHGRHDWMLRRRNDAGDELLPYEREVFDAIFSGRAEVRVSELEGVLRNRISDVRALMYDDMVGQGWFKERPDAVRSRWTTAGWVLLGAGAVLTVVLALASSFGLVGLSVVIAGAALAAVGQVTPARTAKGSRVLAELKEFRAFLESPAVEAMPTGQREELISRFFPYALVFGLGERWADELAATDTDDTSGEPIYWYGAPENWHLSDAAPTMMRLTTALSGAIATRRLLGD